MAKKRGLGKGLDVLLGGRSEAMAETVVQAPPGQRDGGHRLVPIEHLKPGRYQPRTRMDQDGLDALAASIRAEGILQSLVVRDVGGGELEIVAGERRWRAAQLAGLTEVPVVVRDLDDRSALAIALIENIQRRDLNPLEEAAALARLVEEFEMTHEAVASAVGRSRATVSNLLRLLDLHPEVRRMVLDGMLDMGHARALLVLDGPKQLALARRVGAEGLSVRQIEALVRSAQSAAPPTPPRPSAADPDTRVLQQRLSDRLGAAVRIEQGRGGRGRLVILYNSYDELEGILEHLE
jgi:ParB family transcriptional regulator, chromosome partitioning protein